MSELPGEQALKQRVQQRLQSRYVQWLARNKPDTICYREPWRNFCRTCRRVSHALGRLFDIHLPEWLIIGLAILIGVVAVVGVILMCGTLAIVIFRSAPPEVEQLSPEDQSRLGFYRLAIIQLATLVLLLPVGISVRTSSEEFRDFQRVGLRDYRRSQVFVIRVLAGAMILVAWVAAWIIPFDLPWYAFSALATGFTSMVLFWTAYWVSRYLGIWQIKFEDRGAEGIGVFCGFIFCLGVFLLALLAPKAEHAQQMAWLGPTGWLNEQAFKIGEGRLASALPLVAAWGVLLVVGFLARRQATSWRHRRQVLQRHFASSFQMESSKKHGKCRLDDIPADFRNRLCGVPTTVREWMFPAWLHPSRTLLIVMAISCLAAQGVACWSHWFIRRLGEPNQAHFEGQLIHIYLAIAMMVGTIELCGLYNQDCVLRSPFQSQPVSSWGLWKRLHTHGLIRIPVTILWTLPLLIVPATIQGGNPTLALYTLGLSLLAVFALRNLAAALIVQLAIYREMHEWIAAGLRLLAVGVTLAIAVLALVSALPDFQGTYSFVLRQLIAQASSMLFFLLATQAWSWAPRLAAWKRNESAVGYE